MLHATGLPHNKIQIDLSGPEGNVFALVGLAQFLAKKFGYTNSIVTEMRARDYKYAIEVMEYSFGDFIDFYNAPFSEEEIEQMKEGGLGMRKSSPIIILLVIAAILILRFYFGGV